MPREQRRIDLAAEAVMVEAHRMAGLGHETPPRLAQDAVAAQALETEALGLGNEVTVASADGWLMGRVDRVERDDNGIRIIDYKSAVRGDLPERYERQVQTYASMWHDTFGEWPSEALVVYPLLGAVHSVSVTPEVCEAVASESAVVVRALVLERSAESLGRPGDTCRVCDFRPWCQVFWQYQQRAQSDSDALASAYLGFEGEVEQAEASGTTVRIHVRWRGKLVTFAIDATRLPHAAAARPGDVLRLLEWNLRGLRHAPQAFLSGTSELFFVE